MSSKISLGSVGEQSPRAALLILVVGIAIMGYGGYDYTQQSDAVSNAVETKATIVETDIKDISPRQGRIKYEPTATFEYEYDGTSYIGTNIYPATTDPNYDTESKARSIIEDYEEGETVTAYVDPNSPADGFLKAQESTAPIKAIGIGAVFVLLSGTSLIRSGN